MKYDRNPQGPVAYYTYVIDLLSGTVRPGANHTFMFASWVILLEVLVHMFDQSNSRLFINTKVISHKHFGSSHGCCVSGYSSQI